MAKPGKKPKKRRRSIDIDTPLKDAIPTTFSLSVERLSDLEGNEEAAACRFAERLPDEHDLLSRLYVLHRLLMERRVTLEDRSQLRNSLDLLGCKAFSDARAAHMLLARGYPMAGLGPLRAAAEASDLMAYFLMRPDEVGPWQREDPRFDNLGWIRKELPADPTPIYEFLAFGMHANWRLIPHLMVDKTDPLSGRYEILLGPSANMQIIGPLGGQAAFQLMKTLATLHDHRPDLVSQLWRDQFAECRRQLDELREKHFQAALENVELLKLFATATRALTRRESGAS
jgi:hypothetical protein